MPDSCGEGRQRVPASPCAETEDTDFTVLTVYNRGDTGTRAFRPLAVRYDNYGWR